MKLLYTYEDKESGEEALEKLVGEKRLASERDSTVVIYNLFGEPTWANLHRIGLYNLDELRLLLECRKRGEVFDAERHKEILSTLHYVAKSLEIEIPRHWA